MNRLIGQALVLLLDIAELAIFIRVIISWLPVPRDNQFIRLLYQTTEPILAPIRRLIERSPFGRNMMIDFSPIIAFLLIGFIKNVIARMFMVNSFLF